MPKPNDEEKNEGEKDEIELEIDEGNINLDEGMEVDLEEDKEKEEREEKERNKAFASMRIENKRLQEQLDKIQAQLETPKPQQDYTPVNDGVPRTDAEWDALADKDWKKAVDIRANMNAQNVLAANQQASRVQEELEKAKAKVLERHPELNDNSSEKARIFLQVLNNNPDYVNHPKGPIYAMRDMEDHMETVLGYKREDIVSAERNGAQREASRQHRIVLNKGGGKTPASEGNKVTISKEEAEFCKIQGLDPKEFAKTKQKLAKSGKEGVTI